MTIAALRRELDDNEAPLEDFLQGTAQHWKLLKIGSDQSELEFLHGCEACLDLLQRTGKNTVENCRGRTSLFLWKELGRPHPAILRVFLLRPEWLDSVPSEVAAADREDLIDLVDWSCAAYEAVWADRRDESVVACTTEENSAQQPT